MSQRIYNPEALQRLTVAPVQGDRVWAYLVVESDGRLPQTSAEIANTIIPLLVNPEKLEWSHTANYSKGKTMGTSVQSQQYLCTEGRTLKINNILLETHRKGRGLQTYIELFESLLQPSTQGDRWYSPSPVRFSWGSRDFGPAIIKSVNWNEKSWLSGDPSGGQLSLTLEEIPPSDSELARRIIPEIDVQLGNLASPLTERQQQDGNTQADTWLSDNASSLPDSLQDRIRSDRYTLSTDAATGTVTLLDDSGNDLGAVGQWDGRAFITEGVQNLGN